MRCLAVVGDGRCPSGVGRLYYSLMLRSVEGFSVRKFVVVVLPVSLYCPVREGEVASWVTKLRLVVLSLSCTRGWADEGVLSLQVTLTALEIIYCEKQPEIFACTDLWKPDKRARMECLRWEGVCDM